MSKYICTADEVKQILQITASTFDTVIESLLPIINKTITKYCKTDFESQKVILTSDELVFDSTAKTITDGITDSNFQDMNFYDGDFILIEGSIRNDDIKEVKTVSENIITLADTETLTDEDSGQAITISKIVYPEDLKLAFAEIVKSTLDVNRLSNIQHFAVADYSVSYFNSNMSDFAKGILNQYRKLF